MQAGYLNEGLRKLFLGIKNLKFAQNELEILIADKIKAPGYIQGYIDCFRDFLNNTYEHRLVA